MANKQTAVEWFVEQLEEHLLADDIVLHLKNTEAFEIAKTLEQEQIEKALRVGQLLDDVNPTQYYNETYGNKS